MVKKKLGKVTKELAKQFTSDEAFMFSDLISLELSEREEKEDPNPATSLVIRSNGGGKPETFSGRLISLL